MLSFLWGVVLPCVQRHYGNLMAGETSYATSMQTHAQESMVASAQIDAADRQQKRQIAAQINMQNASVINGLVTTLVGSVVAPALGAALAGGSAASSMARQGGSDTGGYMAQLSAQQPAAVQQMMRLPLGSGDGQDSEQRMVPYRSANDDQTPEPRTSASGSGAAAGGAGGMSAQRGASAAPVPGHPNGRGGGGGGSGPFFPTGGAAAGGGGPGAVPRLPVQAPSAPFAAPALPAPSAAVAAPSHTAAAKTRGCRKCACTWFCWNPVSAWFAHQHRSGQVSERTVEGNLGGSVGVEVGLVSRGANASLQGGGKVHEKFRFVDDTNQAYRNCTCGHHWNFHI
jgi:hypothetical protein